MYTELRRPPIHNIMNDQTFHTPSFGDEEFDISSIHTQHATNGIQGAHLAYAQNHHAVPQVGMINPAQDGLAPPGGAPSYQQPLYLQEPHTPVTAISAGAPAGNYMIQQQPGGQQRLLMMQPSQTISGPPTPSSPTQTAVTQMYGRSPQQASPPGTTSDDSDDSVPSQHSQLGVTNSGVKRSSPEPIDNGVNRGQVQKKPKVQKKKKKRDPNEPQKPVSAYALFFRDTQAAIKGQNPNASFGEVSKIVASMWDGLDSEHKSVYKQKTEVAKKEYLKALAAYRASLVSKGGEQENQAMYNHTNNTPNPAYGGYYQGQTYGNGHSPQNYVPTTVPQGYSPQSYPSAQPATGYVPGQTPPGYQPGAQQHQTYPQAPAHSPQTYQQPISGPPPQTYPENAGTSPQNYQSGMTQSPRGYPPAPSPQSYPAPNMSPQTYRTSQSPPTNMGAPTHTMQYHHHAQQMQQVHQYQPQPSPQQQQQQQVQQQQQAQLQQQQQAQLQQMEQHSPVNNNNANNSGMTPQNNDNESRTPSSCIRQGCTNPAIANSEWEDEYCSNECVVSHCRDVFSSWVASNSNSIQNFSAVK